jgi:voltage-gated sodium channel
MSRTAAARPRPGAVVEGARRLSEHPAFDRTIMAVVIANAVVLGAGTYESVAERHGGLLHALNDACLAIFVVELAIRFVAAGGSPRRYFSNGWNVFDFIVVGAAFVPGLGTNSTLLRLARLMRVIRVVRLLPDLRVLVVAVGRALPAVGSLAILTLLLLFVYGMVGWVIFDGHDPERFGTIGSAMLNLFVMLTLENLPENLEMGRELSDWTVVYFLSFALLAAFLLFNLFIGIVINSMEEARALELARAERQLADADPSNDEAAHEVVLAERVRSLRQSLDDLERELARSPVAPVHARAARSAAGGKGSAGR